MQLLFADELDPAVHRGPALPALGTIDASDLDSNFIDKFDFSQSIIN